MTTVIYPPNLVLVQGVSIFLAGPIQGAPDWHSKAISIFQDYPISNLTIACPKVANWDNHTFTQQVDWESQFLASASRRGCIMFWLAKEETHNPDRAYAQTSRFELAEWLTKSPHSVVVGIEAGFSGAKYLYYRIGDMGGTIYRTLEETCKAALNNALDVPNV